MKNKGKSISVKDITSSPIFIAVILCLVIIGIIAGLVYFVMGIITTKEQLVLTRESYQNNIQEIARLEELRAQSEQAEAQLKVFDTVLPKDVGDIYVIEEELSKECGAYNLKLTGAEEPIQSTAATAETSFVFTVQGSYNDLVSYIHYNESHTQLRRIDALSINIGEDEGAAYTAVFTLTLLSQSSAESGVTAPADTETAA